MTTKDYLVIAMAIKTFKATSVVDSDIIDPFSGHILNLVDIFSTMLEMDSPGFDKENFQNFILKNSPWNRAEHKHIIFKD